MTKFSKTRKPKALKGPLPALPRADVIACMQMQYFDNGPNPGSGKNQYTMVTEVYAGGHFNIMKPYWKRTVALLDPEQVRMWADAKLMSGGLTADQHAQYVIAYDAAELFMEANDALWAKLGYFEDRRAHLRYPGQVMLATRVVDGPMHAHVFDGEGGIMSSNAFQFDKFWRPGTSRRLFYGWYDPLEIYAKDKARKESERKALEALATARGGDRCSGGENALLGAL